MDETIQTYQRNFELYKKETPSQVGETTKEWLLEFVSKLSKNAKILELGSAAGRDARFFRDLGLQVFCTDVINDALTELSQDDFKTAYFDFENPPKLNQKFDAIFANAVLLHSHNLAKTLEKLVQFLKPNGYFALSLKNGIGEEISMQKINAPRFFKYYTKETFLEILPSIYSCDYAELDSSGKWLQIILKYEKKF